MHQQPLNIFRLNQRNTSLSDFSETSNTTTGHSNFDARCFHDTEAVASQPLAAIHFTRGFDIDELFVNVCTLASNAGLTVGGLVQETRGGFGGCAQSVHVIDVRSGKKFDIWEDRGSCARGCRLDERGLTISAKIVDEAIRDRVDLLIINRFGRAESLGRGLISAFSQALETGIPLLTGVRAPYTEAWHQFHGGLADDLDNNVNDISRWLIGHQEKSRDNHTGNDR